MLFSARTWFLRITPAAKQRTSFKPVAVDTSTNNHSTIYTTTGNSHE